MAVVTMSYVICNACGVPATDPVDGGFNAARAAAPKGWTVVGGDFCPEHKPTKPEPPVACSGCGLRSELGQSACARIMSGCVRG